MPMLIKDYKTVATLDGKPFTIMPADLFIPPDALEILLESFSGPLDLLLYLIRRQNIDILAIPIALITKQYMHYIQLMEEQRLELALDYLVMAALLAEIKSRFLLPKPSDLAQEIEEDPRLMLIQKLQRYEQFKNAALALDKLPRIERDFFRFAIKTLPLASRPELPVIALPKLTQAMINLIKQQAHHLAHQISREPLSVKERMLSVLNKLKHHNKALSLSQLLVPQEGRMGLVITLLAILELARQSVILLNQTQEFAPIYICQQAHDGP